MSKLNNSERQCHHPLCAGIRRKHIQSLWPVSDARMTPRLWSGPQQNILVAVILSCAALGAAQLTQNVWGNPNILFIRN